jgi:ArsR family transcriptional regulator
MKQQGNSSREESGALDQEAFAAVCKALGHPARVRILQHLQEVDTCICGQIVEILPLAQSTVSQHLKSLKQAGLVKGEVEGPSVCYCVDRVMLERFKKTAAGL